MMRMVNRLFDVFADYFKFADRIVILSVGVEFNDKSDEVVKRNICIKPKNTPKLKNDDEIFFYADTIDDFFRMGKEKNGEDFVIREIYDFWKQQINF